MGAVYYGVIAGGAPSSVANMARHLLNNTLSAEQLELARQYQHDVIPASDHLLSELAHQIAADDTTFTDASDDLILRELRSDGFTAEQRRLIEAGDRTAADAHLYAMQHRVLDRLTIAVERIDMGLGDAPVAMLRQDTHPAVLQGLGLDPSALFLSQDQTAALMAGRDAAGKPIKGKTYATERAYTNEKTGERKVSQPIGSIDFVPSADKSVAVAWAFASPQEQAKIIAAWAQASREGVAYIVDEIGTVKNGKGGEKGEEPGHVTWVEFLHHTSRRVALSMVDGQVRIDRNPETPGDPGLHSHFVVPNAVFTSAGRVGSLDTRDLGGFMHEAYGVVQARFGTLLREQGFQVEHDPRTGAAVMPAIPQKLNSAFSKRTNAALEIAKHYTAGVGENWDLISQHQRDARIKVVMKAIDQRKNAGRDDVADFEHWRFQASMMGWTPPASFQFIGPPPPPLTHEQRLDRAKEVADEWLAKKFQTQSVIKHWDLRTAALHGLTETGTTSDLADISALTKRMWRDGVKYQGETTRIVYGEEQGKRYYSVTTRLHLDQEREFVALAKVAAGDRSGSIGYLRLQLHLNKSGLNFTGPHGAAQRNAIERTAEAGRFSVIIAAAGAGKTSALKPLVSAWKSRNQDVWGGSLAWQQADNMRDAGIDPYKVKAYSVLIDGINDGSIKLNRKSVVAIDEWALLGTKQALDLLRLRQKYDFTIVALADDKQCKAVQAGDIVSLTRRALGPENIPVINTTRRQQSKREKEIAGLFREGEAGRALDMKRQDGTAFMAFGGREAVIQKVADLYFQRLQETKAAPSISAPTNADAHQISVAIRAQRQKMGLVGKDLRSIRTSDNDGRTSYVAIGIGDTVRLFQSTYADFGRSSPGRGGKGAALIGRNGSLLTVKGIEADGLRLENDNGKVGLVRWENLRSKKLPTHSAIGYGYAMTIHTAQGSTAAGHILALSDGAQAIDGNEGYSAMTRHEHWCAMVTNSQAEWNAVRKSRPINSTMEITTDDKWAEVARNLSWIQPKDNALDMIGRAINIRQGSTRLLRQAMDLPDPAKSNSNGQQMRDAVQTRWFSRAYDRLRQSLSRGPSQEH